MLFVKKLGGEQYGLKLESFKTDSKIAVPDEAIFNFRSTGNVQVLPRGYVTVTDPHGKIVSRGLINPESTLVLPETSRQFITLLNPVASSDAISRYTVTAFYRHDEQPDFTSVERTFYQLPVTVLVVVAIVLTLATATFTWIVIRRKNRNNTQN